METINFEDLRSLTLSAKHSFLTLRRFCFKRIVRYLVCVGFIGFLSSTSFAQSTLTDDHSQYGPKAADLYLGNNGGSSATVFLKFSLSGVPPESNLARATLKLYVNSNSPGNPNQAGQYQIDVRDIANVWSEQSPGPQNSGTLLATVPVSVSSYRNFIAIDITDIVQDWINGIRPNNGVALGIRSGPKNFLVLDSKENISASQSPKLELVLDKITGVTATAGLFGGGTTGNVAVGISDGGVTTAKLIDGAITSPKIAPGAVGSQHLATSAVGTPHLADSSVTSLKIANGAVGTPQLATGAVTSTSIATGAVGNQHMADGSVTASKIGAAAVSTAQLATGAVTSTNIAVGAVGSVQLASGAVNTGHIADSSVTSNQIASGQVVRNLNGITDNISLVAGENVTIASSGNTLTISAATSGGGELPTTKFTTKQIALLRWYDVNEASDHIAVGNDPAQLTFDGSHVWVTNRNSHTVTKVRVSDGEVMGTYAAGPHPWGIAFDGSNIWVANAFSSVGTVTKLRASDGTTLGTYSVGSNLVGVTFDGKNIWVVVNGESRVAKLSTDGTVVDKYPVGLFPYGVASDGSNIWVANAGHGNVSKIRASDGAPQGTFSTGVDASALAFDGIHMWVSNFTSGNVTKLRASDGVNMGSVAVGSGAAGVAFDGTYIWVNAYNAASVTKIRASDKQVIGTYQVGVGPSGLAFDGANIWVANSLNHTLVKR